MDGPIVVKGARALTFMDSDKDAQAMVIDSLRAQIDDLVSQVTGLNSKLVKSYDRVSDLEDDLHVSSSNLHASSLQIANLEVERSQHLAALDTGLLVERSHVTTELTRLMEKATDEAAQRGQAESARAAIEKELDDLSAALFGQANTMVAEARFARHNSERKLDEAERALKSAEEAVQLMQTQMQILQTEKEEAETGTQKMEALMGMGKWVDKRDNDATTIERKWLNVHLPYHEYLSFLAHLRHVHFSSPIPPAMSTLLPLPFLARLLTEDSEPTVRLDLAPSLNWLSRRSVLTAIHTGQLTIEPISAASLFAESSLYVTATVAGLNGTNEDITCALCGCSIFSTLEHNSSAQPQLTQLSSFQSNTWSPGAFFRKSSLPLGLNGTAQPSLPGTAATSKRASLFHSQTQIYIFHLASSPSSVMSSLAAIPPLPKSTQSSTTTTSSSPMNNTSTGTMMTTTTATQPTTVYPLCTSGWCLTRLRTTCTLWSFIRTGILEKIWEEEVLPPPAPPRRHATAPSSTLSSLMERTKSAGHRLNGVVEGKPPVPPRRRGLWDIASALGERAVSWGGEGGDKRATPARFSFPPAPENTSSKNKSPPASATPPKSSLPPPPPLPKRSENRTQKNGETSPSTTGTASGTRSNTAPPDPPPHRSPIKAAHLKHSSQGHVSAAGLLLQRSETPSNVPLPESRPGTPSGNGGMLSRTASPAPLSGALPPPIPRRAAARTRGLVNERAAAGEQQPSVVDKAEAESEQGGSEVTKTDGIEKKSMVAPPTEELSPSGLEHEKDGDAETDEGFSINEEKSTPIDTTLPNTHDSENSADEGGDEEEISDDGSILVSMSTNGDHDVVKNGSLDVVVVVADKLAPTESVGHVGEEEISDDGSIFVSMSTNGDHVESDVMKNDTFDIVVDKLAPTESGGQVHGMFEESSSGKDPDAVGDDEKEKRPRGKLEEKDLANYVGDATWEERTWKELVRLRQDMFWARVGGFVV